MFVTVTESTEPDTICPPHRVGGNSFSAGVRGDGVWNDFSISAKSSRKAGAFRYETAGSSTEGKTHSPSPAASQPRSFALLSRYAMDARSDRQKNLKRIGTANLRTRTRAGGRRPECGRRARATSGTTRAQSTAKTGGVGWFRRPPPPKAQTRGNVALAAGSRNACFVRRIVGRHSDRRAAKSTVCGKVRRDPRSRPGDRKQSGISDGKV